MDQKRVKELLADAGIDDLGATWARWVSTGIPMPIAMRLTAVERSELEEAWKQRRRAAAANVSSDYRDQPRLDRSAPAAPAAVTPVIQPQRATDAEGKAAIDYCLQRKRELLGEAADVVPVPVGDLEQDIVAQWHADASIRAEFGELARYAAFRRSCASGMARNYDEAGQKRRRVVDQVGESIRLAEEEDRLAGVDPRLPVEKRAEQAWRLNPKLRSDFGDSFTAYLAIRRRTERSARG